MGILSSLFGFKPQPDDLKMWKSASAADISTGCNCFSRPDDNSPFGEVQLHPEVQDTECDAWRLLESLVETAASKRSKEFAPGLEMSPELWGQIINLPPSIGKLTSVRRLYLYSSHLVRIPPEIGAMTNLRELDIYTSYGLHWLPYEVTRCPKLKQSRASTRALYGNFKYRPPFPRLGAESQNTRFVGSNCSVCGRTFSSMSVRQVWISLRVATDVFPLLVNACSDECVRRLPAPPKGYVSQPHTGGLELEQPQRGHMVGGEIISHDELLRQRGFKQ
jgi:hypothetical protein